MDKCSTIMAIRLENRRETATKVQGILTEYGCNILARMGLREGGADRCTNEGIIILHLCGDDKTLGEMADSLKGIPNVRVNSMKLD